MAGRINVSTICNVQSWGQDVYGVAKFIKIISISCIHFIVQMIFPAKLILFSIKKIESIFWWCAHPAEINIASDLHSIGTIRVRGWSKHTNYLDNYVRVLHKKFCSKFCLFVYLLTKMCAISRNFGPRKFLKKFFSFFHFYFGF